MPVLHTSLEQSRVQYAYKAVTEAKSDGKRFTSYRSRTKGIGNLIMNDGLIGAMTFISTKNGKEDGGEILFRHMIGWLAIRFPNDFKHARSNSVTSAIEDLVNVRDSSTYMRITEEAMSLVRWLRQMVDVCKSGDEG